MRALLPATGAVIQPEPESSLKTRCAPSRRWKVLRVRLQVVPGEGADETRIQNGCREQFSDSR